MLHRARFLSGKIDEELGVKDVTWINSAGLEMAATEWEDASARCVGMMIDGRARATALRRRGEDETLLLIFNAWHDLINFTLPETAEAEGWERLIDTNVPDASDKSFEIGATYQVTGRSVVMFRLVQSDQAATVASR